MRPKDFDKRLLVIRSNYGDDSIALTQWAFEAGLQNVSVVYVNTGWAADGWALRVQQGENHVRQCGFEAIHLSAKIPFDEAVLGRNAWPSSQFQWCSGFLKALPFLEWLDEVDLDCESIIMLAKRRAATKAHQGLPEWIEVCEYHNDRIIWHPMVHTAEEERNALLQRAGFQVLNHRSLECHPCVNSNREDIASLTVHEIQKVEVLELELQKSLLPPEAWGGHKNIRLQVKWASQNKHKVEDKENYLDAFYRGCGNHFGCGL